MPRRGKPRYLPSCRRTSSRKCSSTFTGTTYLPRASSSARNRRIEYRRPAAGFIYLSTEGRERRITSWLLLPCLFWLPVDTRGLFPNMHARPGIQYGSRICLFPPLPSLPSAEICLPLPSLPSRKSAVCFLLLSPRQKRSRMLLYVPGTRVYSVSPRLETQDRTGHMQAFSRTPWDHGGRPIRNKSLRLLCWPAERR